jgi:hypothetical protein
MHLDVHPAHGGKCSAVGALHPSTLDLKEPPKEVLIGFDFEKGLTNDHEAHQLQQAIRRDML